MTDNQYSLKFNNKPARRRNVRPELVAVTIERVELLTIEARTTQAITQLIDGIERRLAIVEDAMPAVGGLTAQSARLARVEEAIKANGATHTVFK